MKSLPLGISDFRTLIENRELYIDKTKDIYNLINAKKYLFLSRPRRFGKSLLISTLEEIFLGNKELFNELSIYSTVYDWKKYPVIKIDFSTGIRYSDENNFVNDVSDKLKKIALSYGVEIKSSGIAPVMEDVIIELAKIERVVILIDEYDGPILNNIKNPDLMNRIRTLLREFYSTIKGLDKYIHKFFMTGVTKVAQTSLFSGPNQVSDISLLSNFQTILGYTQEDLEFYFNDRIKQVASEQSITEKELKEKIKYWYNGYNFSESISKVYNPFSILSFFEFASGKKQNPYQNYWVVTGTPNYLYDIAKENVENLFEITNGLINDGKLFAKTEILTSFNPNDLPLESLLFQAGYLTITNYEIDRYELSYPNNEVKTALEKYLLFALLDKPLKTINPNIETMRRSLEENDLPLFFFKLEVLMAWIPFSALGPIRKEGLYHSIIQLIIQMLGLHIRSEDATNIGKADLVIETQKITYLMEFKVNKTAEEAINQIEEKQYYQKYLDSNKAIVLVGISFQNYPHEIKWISKTLEN